MKKQNFLFFYVVYHHSFQLPLSGITQSSTTQNKYNLPFAYTIATIKMLIPTRIPLSLLQALFFLFLSRIKTFLFLSVVIKFSTSSLIFEPLRFSECENFSRKSLIYEFIYPNFYAKNVKTKKCVHYNYFLRHFGTIIQQNLLLI